jgi:ABC-2 type transport system permease protein
MNLHHISLIIKREFMERLRSPGFIIGTVLGIIGIAGLSFVPALLSLISQETTLKVAVLDRRDLIYPYIPQETATPTVRNNAPGAEQADAALSARVVFLRADTDDETVLSERVKQGKLAAYVIVQGDRASNARFELHSKDRPSTITSSRLLLLLSSAATQARIRESGVTQQQANDLFSTPGFEVKPIVGGTLKDEEAVFQSQALVYVLLILLYGTTVMYGLSVAMGVVYEKSSRVMEILITSVRPIELMLGKIFGIGLVGLAQYALWVTAGFVGLFLSSRLGHSGVGAQLDLASVPPTTLIAFLVFFVLGYLVYAALYAALGSLVNKTEDVNSVTTPITLMLVATYLLSLLALGNTDADYVKVLSFVPFLSPMLMFIRVALSNPAPWEPLLAIVLLIASIFLFAWLAAKIYRVGVLLYGKRPSFREISRMLRTA